MSNKVIHCFLTNKLFSCNVYLLSTKKGNILVDAWFFDEEINKKIRAVWWLDAIILTHGHWDHIRSIDSYTSEFPWAKVYIHKEDSPLLTDTELNCSFLVWTEAIQIKSNVNLLDEWISIIWWYDVELIHTPWHTYWCSMYYFKDENILFSWDMILETSIWTLSTPTGNIEKMKASIKKIKELDIPHNTLVYPGHWEVLTFWEILKLNPYFS